MTDKLDSRSWFLALGFDEEKVDEFIEGQREDREALKAFLDALPPEQREAIDQQIILKTKELEDEEAEDPRWEAERIVYYKHGFRFPHNRLFPDMSEREKQRFIDIVTGPSRLLNTTTIVHFADKARRVKKHLMGVDPGQDVGPVAAIYSRDENGNLVFEGPLEETVEDVIIPFTQQQPKEEDIEFRVLKTRGEMKGKREQGIAFREHYGLDEDFMGIVKLDNIEPEEGDDLIVKHLKNTKGDFNSEYQQSPVKIDCNVCKYNQRGDCRYKGKCPYTGLGEIDD